MGRQLAQFLIGLRSRAHRTFFCIYWSIWRAKNSRCNAAYDRELRHFDLLAATTSRDFFSLVFAVCQSHTFIRILFKKIKVAHAHTHTRTQIAQQDDAMLQSRSSRSCFQKCSVVKPTKHSSFFCSCLSSTQKVLVLLRVLLLLLLLNEHTLNECKFTLSDLNANKRQLWIHQRPKRLAKIKKKNWINEFT